MENYEWKQTCFTQNWHYIIILMNNYLWSRSHEFEPKPGHLTFAEIDHEIISLVILSLPLIQEGHLSVTGEKHVHLGLDNHLGDLSQPRKSVSRLTDGQPLCA